MKIRTLSLIAITLLTGALLGCPGVTPQRAAFASVKTATVAVNDIGDDYQKGLITKAQLTSMLPAIDAVKRAEDAVDTALALNASNASFSQYSQALTDALIELLNERSLAKSVTAATHPATKP